MFLSAGMRVGGRVFLSAGMRVGGRVFFSAGIRVGGRVFLGEECFLNKMLLKVPILLWILLDRLPFLAL